VFQSRFRTSRSLHGYFCVHRNRLPTAAFRIANNFEVLEMTRTLQRNAVMTELARAASSILFFILLGSPLCVLAEAAGRPAKPSMPSQAMTPALPPPGTYKIDTDHSFVYFGAWHHVVGLVRGRFEKMAGTITVSQDLAACAVDISIDTSSISTQNTERDEDLRGSDYFDVKKYPAMTYQGRGIRRASSNSFVMEGTLTIRGVSRTVPLTFTYKGAFPDTPAGKPARMSFHANAATRRNDFGMTRDSLSELGNPPAPGPDIEIQIDVEADAQPPAS
jgi:polyisoprenoid-binding protein YceI